LITASYPALGLSASQSVQVTYTPVTLAHRYSMNESSGQCRRLHCGPAWNGTLPNGGTFRRRQLAFSSASQQYLNLPGGILNNYVATTIEMWVPFISGANNFSTFCLPVFIGDTDSNGRGCDYIFFNPNLPARRSVPLIPGYNGEQGATWFHH